MHAATRGPSLSEKQSSRPVPGSLRTAGIVAAVGLAYFAAARLGLSLAFAAEQVTVVWPPTGIALAALLVLGRAAVPGIALGALAANFTIGEPLVTAAGIATGNTLEAVVAAWLLRRAGFGKALERVRDVLALLGLAGALAPVVSATIGVLALCSTGVQPWSAFGALWRVWWLGDAMGVLLAGPVLLTWLEGRSPSWSTPRAAEAMVLFAALALVCVLVFTDRLGALASGHHLVYAVFPFVIWAALRLGQREVALALLLIEVLAVAGAVGGRGPFAGATAHERLILLQVFMAVTAGTALVMGAGIAERRTADRRRAAEFAITQALNGSATLEEAAPRILGSIRQTLGWDVGAIWIVDRGAGVLRCRRMDPDPRLAGSRFVSVSCERTFERGVGLPGRVWASGAPIWIADVTRADNFPRAAVATADGLRAAFGFPILLGGEVLGVVEFFSREIRLPDDDLLRTFAAVGAQVGLFLDRVRSDEERVRLLGELKTALQAKDEFLAVLGHELRNPLAPLRNAAEILAVRAAGDPAVARIQHIIERQVRHMVRLVDDLLDVSRIARGRVELRREAVSVGEIVAHAVDAARPLMDERGHQVAVETPPEPVVVDGDPVRLEQVVSNLLHNAARYTEGRGHIAVRVTRENGAAVIRVSDDGIGIAPEMIDRVFELFVQGDRPRHGATGGLGIGLTLVRNLVELHGGRVAARSDGPGRGSVFEVRLPVVVGPPAVKGEPPVPARRERASAARKVLVVDDNVDAAESLALVLRDGGCEVLTAYDGAAALAAAGKGPFDIVFLDIALPGGADGHEVARRMRRDPRFDGVTLVALTGFGQEEDRRRSAEAGFDRHLVKPVDPAAVRALLAG